MPVPIQYKSIAVFGSVRGPPTLHYTSKFLGHFTKLVGELGMLNVVGYLFSTFIRSFILLSWPSPFSI
jgi:hypothetical protein